MTRTSHIRCDVMPHLDSRIPVVKRAMQVRADSFNQDKRTVDLVFATEQALPMYHWDIGDYDEKLVCDESAADLKRIRSGGALLREHNRDQQIGVIESAKFENGVGIATARFSTSALGEQEFQDVKTGIRRNFSVSYRVKELTAEKVSDDDGNVYRATSWEPLEISLVSVPADIDCKAIRSAVTAQKDSPTNKPVTIRIPSNLQLSETMKRSLPQFFHHADGLPTGSSGSDPKIDPAELQRQVDAEVNKREATRKANTQEIRDTAKLFKDGGKDVDELAQRCIDEGKTPDQFRALGIAEMKAAQSKPTASGRIEMVGERTERKSVGQRFVESLAYKQIQHARGQGAKVAAIQIDEFDNFRATFATTSVTGFNGMISAGPILEIGTQRPTVADVLASGTTNMNAVPFMQETAAPTNAATGVAEGGTKPEATLVLTQTSVPVKKIAVTIPVTDEAFEDVAFLQSYVDMRLRWMVEMEEERQLLSGAGGATEITGILNTAGIQTQAKGADTGPDAIHKGITKIRAIAFFEPDFAILHPNDWQELKLAKDGNQQYYGGGPFTGAYGTMYVEVPRIWGLPVVVTTGITEGTALVGAGKLGAMVVRRKGITVDSTNSHASDFINNIIRIRAEERLALPVFRPIAFCTITGM